MKRAIGWTAFVVGATVALIVVACAIWAKWAPVGNVAIFGNERIPEQQPASTRIAVFGDTQKGLAGFAALAEIAKKEGVDLAIHTGDLVSRADVGHYALATTWVRRARLGIPFVVTPGNHDIKGGGGLFEERIGPRQFAFRWGPVDIVVIDNAVAPPGEAAVERLLSAAKGPILLFMHVPPNDTTQKTCVPKSTYNCFIEMIRKYPVCYVFSGHAHGYSRIEDDGIVFISNGVGGDSDSWQFDQKAFLTIVEASSENIRAREISIDPVFSMWANFEHLAIGHVGEIVFRTIWGAPALLLLLIALFLGFRRLKKKTKITQEPPKKSKFTPAKLIGEQDIVI